MRFTSPRMISAVLLGFGAIGASPCIAQTRVTSLEELRRQLAAGDFVTVVPAVGPAVEGRLVRVGPVDLDIRPGTPRTPLERGPREITIPLYAIQSLERPRDPVRNGTLIGAGLGAGFGGILFVCALAIDRNEMDEWAPLYVKAAAVFTGIGALIGWATDAAKSKPHIRFDASFGGRTAVRVQPAYSPGGRIAVAVSFSR